MANIMVFLDVDEECVKKCSECDNLSDAINSELGWLKDSGISVSSWTYVSDKMANFLKGYDGSESKNKEPEMPTPIKSETQYEGFLIKPEKPKLIKLDERFNHNPKDKK